MRFGSPFSIIHEMLILLLALLAQARPDDEGFIRNWLMLDSITLDEKASDHTEESQKAFFDKEWVSGTPKAGDKATIGGKELAWRALEAKEFVLEFENKDNVLFLGVTTIVCENEIEGARLTIGSDDSSLWKLNGKSVIRVYAGRGVEKDSDTSAPLALKKGPNVLTFAVINGGGPTGACARFIDRNGKPITGFTIDVPPHKRGYLGVQPEEVTDEDRTELKIKPEEGGVKVGAVLPDTAAVGTIEEGDVILKVAGTAIPDAEALVQAIQYKSTAGQEVIFSVVRKGKRLEIKVKLGAHPED